MPATRLLLIADPKMLPALASGLREGAPFEVLTAPLSDPAAAQAAAEKADAVALFYGAPGAPLLAALQKLSPRIRERGGRMVAVLQRDQAQQRDDCFRAGASEVLFMSLPKEQFVARLRGSLELSWAPEPGSSAPVSVATRTAVAKLEQATVTPVGVESAGELPHKAGETVRLSWGAFQSWGLVVRGGPSARIRFAGLVPEEETRIRDWIKGASAAPSAPAPTPPGGTATVSAPPAAAARAAPAFGPPPGFADRKPVRAQARAPVRVAPPAMPEPAATPQPSAPEAALPAAVSMPGEPAGAASAGTDGTGALFAPHQDAPAPAGAIWPVPFAAGVCKTAALQLLKNKYAPVDLPAGLASSARKITAVLGSAERNALDKGPESHFAEALAARVALDAATSEGVKLSSSSAAVIVDADGVAALMKQADEATAGLQKEADSALGKGGLESLQMVTAASAALSRDLLSFRETADRLRGQSATPRLGAGALDPDLVAPGQGPRPATAKTNAAPAPVRAELRDFHDLDGRGRGRTKTILMVVALLAFIAALANAVFFSLPRHAELTAESAGKGVERIDVSGPNALVGISPEWLSAIDANLPQLVGVLREAEIKRAVLTLPDGKPAGVLDVATGKVAGLAGPKGAAPGPN